MGTYHFGLLYFSSSLIDDRCRASLADIETINANDEFKAVRTERQNKNIKHTNTCIICIIYSAPPHVSYLKDNNLMFIRF